MLTRRILLAITLLLTFSSATMAQFKESANMEIYNTRPAIDLPVSIGASLLTALGFKLISSQDGVDSAFLSTLDPNDVNAFDRPATRNTSQKAEDISDILFYSSFGYGIVLALDGKARDEGLSIPLMYWEALAITSAFYSLTAGLTTRYRPYIYNENASLHDRTSLHVKNSFPGGHPSITATTTFFVAKVYSDLHPESSFKYVLYGIAASATFANAYARYTAGKHFPTDLMTGVAFGTAVGILVPELHKIRDNKETGFRLTPIMGNYNGLNLSLKF